MQNKKNCQTRIDYSFIWYHTRRDQQTNDTGFWLVFQLSSAGLLSSPFPSSDFFARASCIALANASTSNTAHNYIKPQPNVTQVSLTLNEPNCSRRGETLEASAKILPQTNASRQKFGLDTAVRTGVHMWPAGPMPPAESWDVACWTPPKMCLFCHTTVFVMLDHINMVTNAKLCCCISKTSSASSPTPWPGALPLEPLGHSPQTPAVAPNLLPEYCWHHPLNKLWSLG